MGGDMDSDRSFPVVGPQTWINLPETVCSASPLPSFEPFYFRVIIPNFFLPPWWSMQFICFILT